MSHISLYVRSPDFCFRWGTILATPIKTALKSQTPLFERILLATMLILLFPLTLFLSSASKILLTFSSTQDRIDRARRGDLSKWQNGDVLIRWVNGRPQIITDRLELRPIQQSDLPTYQRLFRDPVVTEQFFRDPIVIREYGGNPPRDIDARFAQWLQRWNEHCFSALAITNARIPERDGRLHYRVMGHLMVGHGSYRTYNEIEGFADLTFLLDKSYWNVDRRDDAREIGTIGVRGVGTEAVWAGYFYAKDLKKRGHLVPCDIAEHNPTSLTHRPALQRVNQQGEIESVYLPFKNLEAVAAHTNFAAHRILSQLIAERGGTRNSCSSPNMPRDLFVAQL